MQAQVDPHDHLAMREAIVEGDVERARRLARVLVDSGSDPVAAIEQGFAAGLRQVGDLWDEGEYFLPELVQGAEAMKAAMAIILPSLPGSAGKSRSRGRIVIGTVEGDIHDIGKGLVAVLLAANGFEIHDLGASVPIGTFLAKAAEVDADIVAASALLTTTMEVQAELVSVLPAIRIGGRPHVMLGGAPTSRVWAEGLGAHHAENAIEAVAVAEALLR
jgi:methanogenic corrinoid protein MtbC1